VSFLRTSRQRLLRIRFTGKRLTAEWLERSHFALALLEQLRVDRTLRLGAAVRRGDEPPALGDPTRGRGQAVRGYPETVSPCRSHIKQHSCGNETQDDYNDRAF
jgi:hypothetical protein